MQSKIIFTGFKNLYVYLIKSFTRSQNIHMSKLAQYKIIAVSSKNSSHSTKELFCKFKK